MAKKLISIFILISAVLVFLILNVTSTEADIILKSYPKNQLFKETNFNEGSAVPWHLKTTAPANADFDLKNGKYYVTIQTKGENRWDIQLCHNKLAVEKGHVYNIEFTVQANKQCYIYPKLGDSGDPYIEDWNFNQKWALIKLEAKTPQTIKTQFTAVRSAQNLEFGFHLADAPNGTEFCFDDLSLTDPEFAGYKDDTRPDYREIRVNQLGYFPNREKIATLCANEKEPVKWRIEDKAGKEVISGLTKVFGADKDSGDFLHIIDFTDFKTTGKDYILYADSKPYFSEQKKLDTNRASDNIVNEINVSNLNWEAKSYPFDIDDKLYSKLSYDSLKYYYHSRSGIPIEMPYCDEQQWARRAGHIPDIMNLNSNEYTSWDSKENFTVDATGGWYDADDFGKYVVTGGITVWTLQNIYERCLYNGNSTEIFGDGPMNIPESGNKIPDILDETRWHMEVMLKLQVPEGKEFAGMAFYKGHDKTWNGLAIEPADDLKERVIMPPTTDATLNLAATGAQSYRLFKGFDSEFANRCLNAAKIAWEAAIKNPKIEIPTNSYLGPPPEVNQFADEFYWAACELYSSTGEDQYLNYLKSSPYYLKMPNYIKIDLFFDAVGQFNWENKAALGTLTLALGSSNLPISDVNDARENIIRAGDFSLAIQENQGYGVTIKSSPLDYFLNGYTWGSNSIIANSSIVLAYAYDYSKNSKYLDGATESMDYIMGRNPNEISYITGYGDYFVKNLHHMFFCNQIVKSFPTPPPGICVGGPNSMIIDPIVRSYGWKIGEKAPQKCYLDDVYSWSTNESAINYNAPIVWISTYLTLYGNDKNVNN